MCFVILVSLSLSILYCLKCGIVCSSTTDERQNRGDLYENAILLLRILRVSMAFSRVYFGFCIVFRWWCTELNRIACFDINLHKNKQLFPHRLHIFAMVEWQVLWINFIWMYYVLCACFLLSVFSAFSGVIYLHKFLLLLK